MSVNLPTHFVQEYANNVALLLQQRGSKLRRTVMTGTHVGKQASPVDQIGSIEAQVVTGRFQDKNRVDAPTDRRWVFPTDYDLPQLIDSFDKLRMLTDPESSYVTNGMYAMGRALDDVIIDAYFGDAKTGENGSTTTSFPAGYQVAVDFESSSNVGLTVKKLLEARRLLMGAEVDLDAEPLYCPITAKQHDDLLNEIQVVSTDYNSTPVLVDGRVQSFLGINFIPIERLGVDGSSHRRIPVYVPSAMHLGIWGDMTADIGIRRDLRGNPWEAYLYMTIGATRLEEGRIVEIKCAE